ncbi:MAG TPA: GNAT family N-acetyltransferase [Acidimicrobiales bacterium]
MATNDLTIRAATATDVLAAATVHRAAAVAAFRSIFPETEEPPALEWLVENWSELVSSPDGEALIAAAGDEVVGTVVARTDPHDPAVGQLHRLYVLPELWQGGVGTALHDAAIDRLRARGFARAGLWVLERNTAARAMYERRGWVLVPGREMRYEPSGVIEVRYEREL